MMHRQVHKYGELLYVSIASDYDNNTSDIEQVDKALRDGGMIKIKANSNFISNVMPGAQSYGASNSSGSYYIYGAIINYIASRGWTLVSADGQDDLYFVR